MFRYTKGYDDEIQDEAASYFCRDYNFAVGADRACILRDRAVSDECAKGASFCGIELYIDGGKYAGGGGIH